MQHSEGHCPAPCWHSTRVVTECPKDRATVPSGHLGDQAHCKTRVFYDHEPVTIFHLLLSEFFGQKLYKVEYHDNKYDIL